MKDKTDELLLHTLQYYRSLGFYRNFSSISNRKLAEIIKALVRDSYFGEFHPGTVWYDLEVLSFDQERVWHINDFTILGVLDQYKEDFLGNVLRKLATISKDLFSPQAIHVEDERFTWNTITFLLEGKEQMLKVKADGDVLPFSLFEEINVLLASKNHTFEHFTNPDGFGEAVILLLNKEEKAQLERERSWKYTRYPHHWIGLALEYSAHDEYEKVIDVCHKAVATIEEETEEDWSLLFSCYGIALEYLEKYEEALKWVERAEASDPESHFGDEYLRKKIRLLTEMERYDDALQVCDAALRNEPMRLDYRF